MKPYVTCDGLVLAGGQSTRMQGQNKALILLNDIPLLSYALGQLTPYCTTTRIAAGSHQALYAPFAKHHPLLTDSGTAGPVAGLLAGLQALAPHQWLICSPCDTPLAGSSWVEALLKEQLAQPNRTAFYIKHEGSAHYAHSLWHHSVKPIVENTLIHGRRSLKACLDQADAQAVTLGADYKGSFDNLNTPQEVENLRQNLWPHE